MAEDSNPKVLGIPKIPNATGVAQKDQFINHFKSWKLLDDLIAFCFDTTTSNTGCKAGSAVLIEKDIGRATLWAACQHHIYELHIKHVWEAVIGKHSGPIVPLLKMLQDNWDSISHEKKDIIQFEFPADGDNPINCQAKLVLKWASNCLQKNTFPREDYRELIELVIVYLGGELQDEKTFRFKKPGAYHRARFMHNELYIFKYVMLDKQINWLNQDQRYKLKRMADFIALFQAKAFLQSRISIIAPNVDRQHITDMQWYREIDSTAADAALQSCYRHLWYLTQQLVVFILFDESIPAIERSAAALKLFNIKRNEKIKLGKPIFPQIELNKVPDFVSLIGPDSWLLFDLLKMKPNQKDWLQLPVEHWTKMKDYNYVKKVVEFLKWLMTALNEESS